MFPLGMDEMLISGGAVVPQYPEDFKPVSAAQTELTGIVLSIEPTGERFILPEFLMKMKVFAPPTFLSFKKIGKLIPPDLFDDIECRLNSNRSPSSIPFVTEYQKIRSFRGARNPALFYRLHKLLAFTCKMVPIY